MQNDAHGERKKGAIPPVELAARLRQSAQQLPAVEARAFLILAELVEQSSDTSQVSDEE